MNNKIHFIWVGSPIPDWGAYIIKLWIEMNPDFHIMVHRDGSKLLLDKYKAFYDKMKMICNKVDVLKWCLLQQQGGWVMDIDTVPLRPFKEYLEIVEPDKSFYAVEFSKDRTRLDMGWLGAERNSEVWPIMDEFLVDFKGVNFKKPNQGGHGAINYAYKKAPKLFNVDIREIYCPYSRHDPMRAYGLEFFRHLRRGVDVSEYIEKYYSKYKYQSFGWHLWANGRSVLS